MTRDFYRCASKELRLLPMLGKDPPRAEEELLGPGATRERFRGAGGAGESGGRGGVGRTRGRPVSVSGAERGSRADEGEWGGRGGVGRTRRSRADAGDDP